MSDDLSQDGSDGNEDESSEDDEAGEVRENNVRDGFNFNNDQVVVCLLTCYYSMFR
jgi:hypothetical protein